MSRLHPRTRRLAVNAGILAVFALALAIRLIWIGHQSLWGDEACMVYLARSPPGEIVRVLAAADRPDVDVAPPLYMIFLHGWMKLYGSSLMAVRGLSALAGALAALALIELGRLLYSEKVGLAAGMLAAVSPMLVWYSQEARMYSLGSLLVTLSVLAFVRGLRVNRKRDWLLFAAACLAGLYTQYYFVLTMAAHLAVFGSFLARDRRPPASRYALPRTMGSTGGRIVRFGLAWGVPVAAFVPWLPVVALDLGHAAGSTVYSAHFSPLTSMPFVLAKLATFGTEDYVLRHPTLYLIAGVVFGLALVLALLDRELGLGRRILGAHLLLPMALVYAASLAGLPVYKSHPFVMFAPIFCLLAARGMLGFRSGHGRLLLPAALLVNAYVLGTLNFGSEYTKPKAREVLAYLETATRPGDRVVALPAAAPAPLPTLGDLLVWEYYNERQPVRVETTYGWNAAQILTRLGEAPAGPASLWVISHETEPFMPELGRVLATLGRRYQQAGDTAFSSRIRGFGLTVHRFVEQPWSATRS